MDKEECDKEKIEVKNLKFKSKCRKKPNYLTYIEKHKALELEEKKLHRAIITNNTDTVEELLEQGVSPNASDHLFRSPLHLATSRGYKEIVQLLLKYGVDLTQKDVIGNTALHLAACINNIEIITLLLDAGADASSLDIHGRNPLHLAQSKLKLIQSSRRDGAVELTQMKIQLQQVIDLMMSFLRKKQTNVDSLQLMKLNLNDGTESQLDDQVSILLNAIQDMSLK